jgi:hypothetical protein
MRTLRSLLGLGTLAALVALALAACGGSGSTTSTAAQHSSTPAPTSSNASATTSSSAGGSSTTPSSSGTTTSAGSAAVNGCPSSGLHLSFVSGQGAAGTAYMTYALTNIGTRPCTLYGYPGVSILDAAGRIVQHPAQRGGIQAPTTVRLVTLAQGRQARFIVTSSDVIPSPGCPHAFTGTTLQVFPPNQRQALSVTRSGQFCNLHVGPVEGPH